MKQQQTIPLYIISGFLGSGKTTLLLHMLKECQNKNLKPAIILNELGEENVEKEDFQQQQLIALLNGCICCTIQEDLTKELEQLLSRTTEVPDLIIIEGTGVANPLEIVEAVTQPQLLDKVELQAIISLIDASKFLEYQSIFSSTKEIRTILKDQLIHASLLILNKIDLISKKELQKVKQKIEKSLPTPIPMLESSMANVAIEQIFQPRLHLSAATYPAAAYPTPQHHVQTEQPSSFQHEQQRKELRHGERKHTDHQHADHVHHHAGQHGLFQAIRLEINAPLPKEAFEKWIATLPKEVIRAKGIIEIREQAELFQFQYASNQINYKKVTADNSTSAIILIGYKMPISDIQESFQHFLDSI